MAPVPHNLNTNSELNFHLKTRAKICCECECMLPSVNIKRDILVIRIKCGTNKHIWQQSERTLQQQQHNIVV